MTPAASIAGGEDLLHARSQLQRLLSSDVQTAAVVDVLRERARQDEKWGAGRRLDPESILLVLTEEVGEFAQAVLLARGEGGDPADARAELVQVAAVALFALEACDLVGSRWPLERRSAADMAGGPR